MHVRTCATANLITTNFASRLKIKTNHCSVQIVAVNSLSTCARGNINICIQLISSNFDKVLNCFIIPRIAYFELHEVFPRDSINIPSNLLLANPQFYLLRPVDILIGAGTSAVSMIQPGQFDLSTDLILQKNSIRLGHSS